MKNDKINYVLVGSFVIAMIAALLFSIALLTGRTGATDTYFTRYDDATGLKYGSQVLYMGFPVGQVEEITPVLENGKVRFELELSATQRMRQWKVPADSVAEVRAAGLLAAVTIDIRAGSSTEILRPGARIVGRGQVDVFGAVQQTADTLRELTVSSLQPLLENLNRYVSSFGAVLADKGGPLIENLSELSGQLSGRASEVIDDFLKTTAQVRGVSERLSGVLSDDNTRKAGTVMDNVVLASEDLAQLTSHARGQFEELLGAATLSRVEQILGDAGATSAAALELARSARAGLDRTLSASNLDRVDRSIANIEAATDSLLEVVDEDNRRAVDNTLRNVEAASQEVQGLIGDTRAQVSTLLGPGTSAKLDQALANVSGAAANIAQLSAALDTRLGEVLTPQMSDRLKQSLENFSLAAGNIASLSSGLAQSRRHLDVLLVNLNETTTENRADVRESVRAMRHTLRTVSQHIDTVASDLAGTSRNMLELSRRLKSNPGLLLRAPEPDDEARPGRRGG